REILREVITLLRRLGGPDGTRVFEETRVELARLTADESVKVLEAAPGRPAMERPLGAPFPGRRFVAFTELRSRVTVHEQGFGDGCRSVRPVRGVARRRRGHVRDR